MSTNGQTVRKRQVKQLLAAAALSVGLACAGVAPAHATWSTYHEGTVYQSKWIWSGHHTNTGGNTQIQWPFSGTAHVLKGSSIYSGSNYVFASWPSSYDSIACRITGDINGMPGTCQTNR